MTGAVEADGRKPRRSRHYPQLDGFRGVCILLVVLGHTGAYSCRLTGNWNAFGELGVLLFFALSGFLITDILYQEYAATGRVALGLFYGRRALRLGPALAFFLLVVSVLKVTGLVEDTPWKTIAAGALYVRDIFGRGLTTAHLWSLSVEEQFYLTWPFLFVLFPRRRVLIAAGISAAVVIFRGVSIHLGLFDYVSGVFYERPWFRFDSLLVGCLLALLWNEGGLTEPTSPAIRSVAYPLALALGLGFWCYWADRDPLRPIFLTVQVALAGLLLAHVIAYGGAPYYRWLHWRRLGYVGTLSYSWYLWQNIFIVTKEPSWSWVRVFPIDVALSFVAAVTSYKVIEKPFLAMKRRLHGKVRAAVRVSPDASRIGEGG